ncbi:MAG: metalloprotease secretion chaperone CpaB [Pseudomonadota bacterium]|nr:metalloprotease secretion chaperone CpaB [Pseudomonadota bacterium]
MKQRLTIPMLVMAIVAFAVIVMLGFGIARWLGTSETDVSAPAVAEASSNTNSTTPNSASNNSMAAHQVTTTRATTPHDANAVLARRASMRLDPALIAVGQQKTQILELVNPQEVFNAMPYLTEKQRTDQRSFIRYDPYVIETKFVGDAIDIYIPEIGTTLLGVIEQVETQGEVIRWAGTLQNFNSTQSRFSISQTIRDNYAVATFDTPMGSFNLEAKNGLGWIVNQTEDFHLPSDGKDYVDVPNQRGGATQHSHSH